MLVTIAYHFKCLFLNVNCINRLSTDVNVIRMALSRPWFQSKAGKQFKNNVTVLFNFTEQNLFLKLYSTITSKLRSYKSTVIAIWIYFDSQSTDHWTRKCTLVRIVVSSNNTIRINASSQMANVWALAQHSPGYLSLIHI